MALPSAVMPEVEIWNPSPLETTVHFTPAVDDAQVKGPTLIVCPYCSVGVFSPAFPRHWPPVHAVNAPSGVRVADLGGEIVSQNAWVSELGP